MRLALALLAVLLAGCSGAGREVGPLVGNLAPAIEVTDVDGAPWSLAAQRGKVVMVDLMGVNCPPCRREMPHLVAFEQAHRGEAFAALSVDMAGAFPALASRDDAEVRAFRDAYDATWPFAPDRSGAVGRAYELLILPTKVFVDAEGVIRAKVAVEVGSAAQLEQYLAQARGS